MGALYHRERTGEATTVDVSLLGVGLWSMGAAVALSLQLDVPWAAPPRGSIGNPLTAIYATRDGHFISFTCLQAVKYWPEIAEIIGRPDLAHDERYTDPLGMMEHAQQAWELLTEAFATRDGAEWREALADFSGQWTMVQDTIEVSVDPQTVANGYVAECHTAAGTPFRLVTPPVQFGEVPANPNRAPEFNEHGDEILEGLGLDWDTIVDLKVKGVVA
jgi:crotonobetainyl-CoA:carnitine CoA-transferase CaiB-like acyl-CoA transferase